MQVATNERNPLRVAPEAIWMDDQKKVWEMSRDIKTIKKDILDQFRAIDGEANDKLPTNWLENEYFPVLDFFERQDFEKAVRQLAANGVVVLEKGPVPVLKLTEKGANLIH